MCILDKLPIKNKEDNDNYLDQLKELVLCFSKLKTSEARRLLLEFLKEIERRENEIRH
jgi:hypothetical protein